MSVKVTSNRLQIVSETDNRTSLAIRFMLEAIHRESTPTTPKKDGLLRADVTKVAQGKRGYIMWDKNYAVYQEKKQYTNYTTAGTGPHFAENAARKVAKNAQEYFRKAGL